MWHTTCVLTRLCSGPHTGCMHIDPVATCPAPECAVGATPNTMLWLGLLQCAPAVGCVAVQLIHYVNKDGRVNALYSTPSRYLAAKRSSPALKFPLKTDDFFPYCGNTGGTDYWTGFYTSRPTLKAQVCACVGQGQCCLAAPENHSC
jgi:hypothetical protein